MTKNQANVFESKCDIIVFVSGSLCVLLAFLVLIGWLTHIPRLIQIQPELAPMQYNTALGFLFLGFALLFVLKWRQLAMILAVLALLIGGLTLAEYLSLIHFDVDQLFMKAYIFDQTSHPGRMAPNTALCFVLGSLALLTRRMITFVLSLFVLMIGFIALTGHIAHLPNTYGWGKLTGMALHTSIGFIIYGIGVLTFSWKSISSNKVMLQKFLPAIILVVGWAFFLLFWQSLIAEDHPKLISWPIGLLSGDYKIGHHLFFLITGFTLTIFLSLSLYFWISTQKQAEFLQKELELRSVLESRFQAITMFAKDAIIAGDPSGRVIFWNKEATNIFGYTVDEAMGKLIYDLVIPSQYKAGHIKGFNNFQKTGSGPLVGKTVEVSARKKDGTEFPIEISISTMVINGEYEAIAIIRDITERKKTDATIYHQANYDALTDLPNRLLFSDRLKTALDQTDRTGFFTGLLLIDLDDFKVANDHFGHKAGDELLKQASARFLKSIRKTDTVARMGGDEFMVILTNVHDKAEIVNASQKILKQISKPFDINKQKMVFSASIGVAIYPENARDLEDLLKKADTAMYSAKRAGKNQIFYCNVSY